MTHPDQVGVLLHILLHFGSTNLYNWDHLLRNRLYIHKICHRLTTSYIRHQPHTQLLRMCRPLLRINQLVTSQSINQSRIIFLCRTQNDTGGHFDICQLTKSTIHELIFVGTHTKSSIPSIAQLVERRTVEVSGDILRSLVRIRLEGNCSLLLFSFISQFWLIIDQSIGQSISQAIGMSVSQSLNWSINQSNHFSVSPSAINQH